MTDVLLEKLKKYGILLDELRVQGRYLPICVVNKLVNKQEFTNLAKISSFTFIWRLNLEIF